MQTEILRENPGAYMWIAPRTTDAPALDGLVQRRCARAGRFRDLLICRAGYRFSKLDQEFMDKLYLQKNNAAFSL